MLDYNEETQMKKGQKGWFSMVDSDGDVSINFEDHGTRIVRKRDLVKLNWPKGLPKDVQLPVCFKCSKPAVYFSDGMRRCEDHAPKVALLRFAGVE
eukprot:gene32-316_t